MSLIKIQTPIPTPHKTPNLIVGAGLAGCLLAWRLEQRGQDFQLIGSTQLPNAWSVAAGIINPVTGKWMTKSWNVEQLIPAAEHTYRAIEQQFDIQIYHPMPLRRYYQNSSDAKRAGRRKRNPRYHDVLGDFSPPGSGPEAIIDLHGSFEILQASYVDLPLLISTLQQYFKEKGLLRDETFQHADLVQTAQSWHYKTLPVARVFFCEGMGIQHNPWFNDLPMAPAKGETLILRSDTLELPQSIYHHTKWLLPYQDHSFRVGATYSETDRSPEPTEAGKAELLDNTRAFILPEHTLEVCSHLVGIRPCTQDSKPLLGQHPQMPGLFILNGLGSKGASVAPLMSQQLLAHVFDNAPLDPATDIARFNQPETPTP